MAWRIGNIINNIGSYCGLSVSVELGYSSMKLLEDKIRRDTKGAENLEQYLLYRYYDNESGLFINEDGVVGFMLELSLIVGSDKHLEKNLNLFFNNELPEEAYLQFLLVAGHNIEDKLNIWRRGRKRSTNAMLNQLTKYREEFLREKARDFGNCDGRLGRDYRLYVSYSSKVGRDRKKLEIAKKFQKKLKKKLESINLYPRSCDANDLILIVRDLLQMQLEPSVVQDKATKQTIAKETNSNNSRTNIKYNPYNSLAQQVILPLMRIKVEDESLIHEDTGLVTKCFYPSKLPEEHSLLQMIELLGSEDDGGIPARFVISYSIATNISQTGEETILARGKRSIHASEKWYARHDLSLQHEAIEWQQVIDRHKNGQRFLTDNMQIVITAPREEIELAEEKLKSHYNSLDWQLKISKTLQLASLISIMPMHQAQSWEYLKYFRLASIVQSREVVAKLPIHGEWKGVDRSGVLLLGRRGEIFNWNPYCRIGGGGNYNVCVIAPAGSGKSFLLQELATSLIAQDVAVFILDIGSSYQNVCELLEGEIVRFNGLNDISLNPFSALASSGAIYVKAQELLKKGLPTKEVCMMTGLTEEQLLAANQWLLSSSDQGKEADDVIEILQIGTNFVTKDAIIYAKRTIASMCGATGDHYKEAIIERAINKGVELYGEQLNINRLVEILHNIGSEVAEELSGTLYPYSEEGVHGRYFKSGKTASFKEIMTIFEFEEIKNDPVLLSVILQVILMQITMQFLCGDRSRRFALIVDEAWCIMNFSSAFLENFARTVRKYGGSLVTCVQDYSSFTKGASQRAIFENSTWKAILMQDASGLEAFKDSEQFKDYLPLIESIRKDAENKYSEVALFTNGLRVIGRLVVDPYTAALYSTEREDYYFLSQCKVAGMSKDVAIKELSKKYGSLPAVTSIAG